MNKILSAARRQDKCYKCHLVRHLELKDVANLVASYGDNVLFRELETALFIETLSYDYFSHRIRSYAEEIRESRAPELIAWRHLIRRTMDIHYSDEEYLELFLSLSQQEGRCNLSSCWFNPPCQCAFPATDINLHDWRQTRVCKQRKRKTS